MCPFQSNTPSKGELLQKPPVTSRLGLSATVATLVVFVTAGVGLLGQTLDIAALKEIGVAAMSPIVTGTFLLAAGALWLLRMPRLAGDEKCCAWKRGLGHTLALVVSAAGLTVLLNMLLHFTAVLNRVATATALNFLLLGMALLLLEVETRRGWRPAQLLLVPVIALSILAVIGYVCNAVSAGGLRTNHVLALTVCGMFLALAVAALCVRPDVGFMPFFASSEPGSAVLRRVLPLGLVALSALSLLRLHGQNSGWFNEAVGTALVMAINVVVFATLVIGAARWLNRLHRERQAAHRTLGKSEQKFRDLLEAAPDAIVIVNDRGRIVLVNSQSERLFGYARSELEGQVIEILLPEKVRERHVQHRDNFFASAHRRPMGLGLDLYGRHKDGHEIPVEISLSPLQTDEGLLVTSAIRDASDRKRVEHALQEASRMKSEFLANLSHELRTPLNGIIGFSEFLVDEKPGRLNPKQKEYLGDVLNSARHLHQLINDVLDLAKIEAGRMELNPEVFSLRQATDEVCSVVNGIAKGKRITIDKQLSQEVDVVKIDQQKFKQVLYNLLSNAIKFTNEGGRVEILTGPRNGDGFVLKIKDTGIGIKPEDMGRLFRKFEQLETGTDRQYEGTGLGLALTKRLVELHHGAISVESTFGQGSTFTALFPKTVPSSHE